MDPIFKLYNRKIVIVKGEQNIFSEFIIMIIQNCVESALLKFNQIF